MRRGIVESISTMGLVIVAIFVGFVLFSILIDLFPTADDNQASGSEEKIAKEIAEKAQDCWKSHRRGLDSVSSVCAELHISSEEPLTELAFVNALDCSVLPDSICDDFDCSFCGDRDAVEWNITSAEADIKISYSGSKKIIEIKEI